ncbi:putative acetyltransferase [Halobacteriovorax marinus SJ]|uniref:Acetyltransferase n=1 Tax=Halobacteriovorax marinus (strain ATCC BAA-682 / DSM 15412 / SJ) TaxID=862908 RepID=E1X1S1_HALMS|nr:GNAT family N-acetyltransferase [Halobacteriovorax marinus]CBW24990.1 putative acetyltransferase [Halobacteriovorax marinus SJ]
MINYSNDRKLLESLDLSGFFVGWPNPPSENVFKKILAGSYKVVLAFEDKKLIGFINSISDGILSAYIPLLEVLPEYQGKGIGKELVKNLQDELKHLYMVDLLCDEELIPYYEKIGMMKAQGAFIRNYDRQSGE